ncbi:protein of unknown function [Pedococcus cremeus]|uniref:DUF202 domain-containing protein n=1 Tax=Pedococcus cremeus TaxID=587636 RepID=A0A1H9X104_9MICO|nr:DUF202 domain-containing protein [Pedococcus cremeus]SES39711.1 protein of unknown function [Pedococcus cremeus]
MSRIPERQALQPERTSLSWQRTALTAMVLLVPVVVVAARLESWWLVAIGSVVAMGCAVLVLGVRHRFDQLRDDSHSYSPFPVMVRVAVVTVLGALGGVAAAVAVMLRPG